MERLVITTIDETGIRHQRDGEKGVNAHRGKENDDANDVRHLARVGIDADNHMEEENASQ